jgi:hypothetical protein
MRTLANESTADHPVRGTGRSGIALQPVGRTRLHRPAGRGLAEVRRVASGMQLRLAPAGIA